jgi:hypothetical protein
VLALLVAGCGSTSGSATGGSSAPSSTPAAVDSSAAFCGVIRDQISGLNSTFPKDFSSADQLKAYGTYLEETNTRLLAAAPPEIHADVAAQVAVSNESAAAYKSGSLPPAAASAKLRAAEYRAAAAKVLAYAKDKCGISPSVAPTS